jgi:hypothetical protein
MRGLVTSLRTGTTTGEITREAQRTFIWVPKHQGRVSLKKTGFPNQLPNSFIISLLEHDTAARQGLFGVRKVEEVLAVSGLQAAACNQLANTLVDRVDNHLPDLRAL